MKKKTSIAILEAPKIEEVLLCLRGQKVLLDRDLATIYGVPTKALNQAVRRNFERFPPEFYFQLTDSELRVAVTNCDRNLDFNMVRTLPYAFTEHGALMAATVLNSPRAVQMSLFIIRTFTKMRELLISQEDLSKKLKAIEERLTGHDIGLRFLFGELQRLLSPKRTSCKEIGFHTSLKTTRCTRKKI